MNKKRKAFGEIPQEVSQNLQAPELAPSDKRFTGRTKQLNFKVREDFYWQLKNRAVEEQCMLVEVLERAFTEYVKQPVNFAERKKEYFADKLIDNNININQTINKNSVNNYQKDEEPPEFCSFNEIDDKTKKAIVCYNCVFDKKKQLCRFHNRQVRKRFNEFIKDESIAGSGAWEMAWEQSGDWKYFWNLAQEKEKHEK